MSLKIVKVDDKTFVTFFNAFLSLNYLELSVKTSVSVAIFPSSSKSTFLILGLEPLAIMYIVLGYSYGS